MNLPIYQAVINDENDGVFAVSLVDMPATEVDWLAFESHKEELKFAVDDVKHCLTAPLMLADTPIYRRNGDYEYYITYSKETLRIMAEKMLKDNTFNEIDFQHNGNIIEKGKVNLVELYIKDENKTSPFDVNDGSIICTYKINDDEIWEAANNGTFNGFSLAGYFGLEEIDKYTKQNKMSLKDKLKELFLEYAKVESDKGVLVYEGELAVDTEVTDENGEPIADGDYTVEDKVYVIADGKVAEIKDVEEPTEPTEPVEPQQNEEEPTEPTEPATEPVDLDAVNARLDELEAKIAEIAAKLEEVISTPAVEPIADEFNAIVEKANKWTKIGSYIKK